MKTPIVASLQNLPKALLNLSPRLKFLYSQHRQNRNLFRRPVQTPYGFEFCGNKSMETGEFEKDEVAKIRELLTSVDLFVNVGANIGYYTCIAAKLGKRVIAFEPDPANCRLLLKNLHLNGFADRVEVFPIALGNQSGLLELFGFGTGASLVNIWDSKDDGVLTPIHVLDQLIVHRVATCRCLFLVDVEGAEHLVISGAADCLERADAVWVVEITSPRQMGNRLAGADRYRQTFRLFAEKGYAAFLLADGLPVSNEEIDMAVSGVENRLSEQNMFMFRRSVPVG